MRTVLEGGLHRAYIPRGIIYTVCSGGVFSCIEDMDCFVAETCSLASQPTDCFPFD